MMILEIFADNIIGSIDYTSKAFVAPSVIEVIEVLDDDDDVDHDVEVIEQNTVIDLSIHSCCL